MLILVFSFKFIFNILRSIFCSFIKRFITAFYIHDKVACTPNRFIVISTCVLTIFFENCF